MQRRVVRRQSEAWRGDVVPCVESVVPRHAQDGGERNELVRIEAMVNTRARFGSVPGEGLFTPVLSTPDFGVGVRETAARQTDGEVRVRTERLANAEFGIDVNGRDGQPQRQVRLDKARLVEIVKSVAGERPTALQRLIVTELKEPALLRIDLRAGGRRRAQIDQKQEPAPLRSPIHRRCRSAIHSRAASRFVRADAVAGGLASTSAPAEMSATGTAPCDGNGFSSANYANFHQGILAFIRAIRGQKLARRG